MSLIAEHGWPLRHNQWLQLLMDRSLLYATGGSAVPARIHLQLRTAKVETGVLLRGRTMMRMRIDVIPRCGWRRGLVLRLTFVVRHRLATAQSGLRQRAGPAADQKDLQDV